MLDTLRQHGFGDVLVGGPSWPEPDRVRAAVEELGLVYVKFGQVLSTRSDLLPDRYLAALAGLQDDVSPLPASDIHAVIHDEFGTDAHTLFEMFNDEPLGSASVAQVHTASLRSGARVVVKIQRPGLGDQLSEDLLVLAHLASLAEVTLAKLRPFDLPSLVREFKQSLEAELDFGQEAQNIRRFRRQLADDARVWIPDVIDDLSTARVLTLERSDGVRLEEYVKTRPDEARLLARRLGGLFVRQVFRDGVFHADPHPGNIFVMDDGVLCLHDFGMIGGLSEPMREALVDLVEATVSGDARAATNSYLDLGLVPRDVDRDALEDGVAKLVEEIRGQPLADVSVGRALESLGRLGGRYRIRNPGAFMLLSRAFVTLEGVLARLDPTVGFVEMFPPAFTESVQMRISPTRLRRDAVTAARALDRLAREAPDDVRRIVRRWGEGAFGRVTVVPDSAQVTRAARSERNLRQVRSAGVLPRAGAVLLRGASVWVEAGGIVLFTAGTLALAYRFARG
ncbi:MAG: AarF/UbiB family protein [Gemmatimonadota bacterium]|nr:AarF/UbiB family protein [Gemmatimonadota bacterium]